jgi:hypothetical protein
MPSAGFEPAVPAGDWLQTHVLDRSASGICKSLSAVRKYDRPDNGMVLTSRNWKRFYLKLVVIDGDVKGCTRTTVVKSTQRTPSIFMTWDVNYIKMNAVSLKVWRTGHVTKDSGSGLCMYVM